MLKVSSRVQNPATSCWVLQSPPYGNEFQAVGTAIMCLRILLATVGYSCSPHQALDEFIKQSTLAEPPYKRGSRWKFACSSVPIIPSVGGNWERCICGKVEHSRAAQNNARLGYAKSLCVPIPFYSARDSILALFDPIMTGNYPCLT